LVTTWLPLGPSPPDGRFYAERACSGVVPFSGQVPGSKSPGEAAASSEVGHPLSNCQD
jgi:hypothetical protein